MSKYSGYSRSSSGWEDSYFGGYEKVLWDYPDITIPYEVDAEVDNKERERAGLSYYTFRKLYSLFLLKVNSHELSGVFLSNAKPYTKKSSFFFKDRTYLRPDSVQIAMTVQEVINHDNELANLFKNYRDVLISTDFLFPYKEDQEEKEKKTKEGGENLDENDDDSGEGEKQNNDGTKGESESPSSKSKQSPSKNSKKEDDSGKNKGGDKQQKGTSKEEGKNESGKSESDFESMQLAKKLAQQLISEVKKREKLIYGNGTISNGLLSAEAKFVTMQMGMKCSYSKDETIYAGMLMDMLDISFDPDSDKIGDLRAGKIDIAKLGSVPAGNHQVYYRIEENQITKPFSVCILGDESGSMHAHGSRDEGGAYVSKLQEQNKVMKILYKAFSQIMHPSKIFVYGHSGLNAPEIRVYNDKYNQIFEETIDYQFRNKTEQNYDGPAIEGVYKKVREMTDDNILFICLSDGEPSGYGYGGQVAISEMKKVMEKCKRDGFVTAGVGILDATVKDIYPYNTIVKNLGQMPRQISVLLNHIVKTEFQ